MCDITPDMPFPLAGYVTKKERMCTKVRDPLTARAIVLGDGVRKVVLVSVDLLVVSPALRDAVLQALNRAGADLDGILLCATHTHSGPGGYWDIPSAVPFMGDYRQTIFDRLVKGIVEAVRTAEKGMGPADVSWGETETRSGTSFNRRNRKLQVDPSLSLLILKKKDELIRAVFFGAHPVVVAEHEKHTASACFPAKLLQDLESEDEHALFLNGAAGGVSILWPRKVTMEEHLTRIRDVLLEAVAQAEGSARPLEGPVLGTYGVPVPIHARMPRLFPPALLPLEGVFLPLRWRLKRFGRNGLMKDGAETEVRILRIGNALIAGFPADMGPGVALAARSMIREEGLDPLALLSYCGDYIGYVHMPEDYRAFWEWTADGLFLTVYENGMGFGGRQVGSDFLHALRKAIRTLREGDSKPPESLKTVQEAPV